MPPLHELGFQYQPIVGFDASEPFWAEALVRWRLRDGTVRGPLHVLPHWLTEQRQDVFTRFCLERAAAALAEHRDAVVSVNLSPTQVTHPQTLSSLEASILELDRIFINGGKRGFMVEIDPGNLERALKPHRVSVAVNP